MDELLSVGQRMRPFSARLAPLALLQRVRDLLRDTAQMFLAQLKPDWS